MQIDDLSPHSYIWALLSGDSQQLGPGACVAWRIAAPYNVDHLADRRAWHLSGAALTIWLTRNWTMDELIAKAVELEKKAPKVKEVGIRSSVRVPCLQWVLDNVPIAFYRAARQLPVVP
jgi:hypothetical protein